MGWAPIGPDDVARCTELARRGLENAGGDATVMAHCGMALLQVAKLYDWGMAVLEEALEINPDNLLVVTAAGTGHLHCGSLETALQLFERAILLSPRDPVAHITLCGIADVHFIRGDYRDALHCAARSHAVNPNFDATLWVLIAAHALLGERDDARRYLAELQSIAPQATLAAIRSGQPTQDPSRFAALYEGLRLAGLPEGDLQDFVSA